MSRQAERNVRRPAPAPQKGAAAAEPRRARTPWHLRLRAWREQHLYSFFSSLGRLAARPWASVLTVLVLGFALALPLLFFLVFDNARALSGGLREAREVTAFLKPSVNAADAGAFAEALRGRGDVGGVLVRTPEQGLEEFRQLSGFGEALDALRTNPLPTVLVVTPQVGVDDEHPALVTDLQADARVDLVQYDAQWRRRLSGILHFGERVVAIVAVLLALATLLVIGNTVRMDIQARAEEISVMQLMGASNGFVRRPFLYSGLWYGLFGSVFALLVVAAAQFALAEPVGRLLDSYAHRFSLHGIGVLDALIVVIVSALLGWLGAFVATARHLAAGWPGK
jgi:cell division transport system permease protein